MNTNETPIDANEARRIRDHSRANDSQLAIRAVLDEIERRAKLGQSRAVFSSDVNALQLRALGFTVVESKYIPGVTTVSWEGPTISEPTAEQRWWQHQLSQ